MTTKNLLTLKSLHLTDDPANLLSRDKGAKKAKMPLVRIALLEGKPPAYLQKISDSVHRALVETISVPPQDRFQLITEHKRSQFIYDPAYLNIARTDNLVIVQITLSQGRTLEAIKSLYKRMVELLVQEANLRPEDVFINLVEVAKENWSFGNGVAQYAT